MNQPLYTVEILRLAASIPTPRTLPDPHGIAEKRSTTCGSTVRTEVMLDQDGQVAEIAQKVEACAFGQASASLLASSVIGSSREAIEAGRDEFASWLQGERDNPGCWPGLSALAPARTKRARHPAMLLPFDALIAAIDDARERHKR